MSKLILNLTDLRPADPRKVRDNASANITTDDSRATRPADTAGSDPAQATAADAPGTDILRREIEAIRAQLEYERQIVQAERQRQTATEEAERQQMQSQRDLALATERQHVQELQAQLQQMTQALQAERNALEVERQAMDEARQAVENERQTLQREAQQLAAQTEQARNDRQSLEQTLAQLAQQRQKIDQAVKALDEREREIRQQSQQVDSDRGQIEAQQQALAEARTALREQRKQLDQQQVAVAGQADTLQQRQQQLDSLAEELAGRQGEMNNQLDDMQNRSATQDARLETFAATADSARLAESLAHQTMHDLDQQKTAEGKTQPVGPAANADNSAELHDLLHDLPLEDSSPGKAARPRTRRRRSLQIVAVLLVLHVAVFAILGGPSLLGWLETSDTSPSQQDSSPSPQQPLQLRQAGPASIIPETSPDADVDVAATADVDATADAAASTDPTDTADAASATTDDSDASTASAATTEPSETTDIADTTAAMPTDDTPVTPAGTNSADIAAATDDPATGPDIADAATAPVDPAGEIVPADVATADSSANPDDAVTSAANPIATDPAAAQADPATTTAQADPAAADVATSDAADADPQTTDAPAKPAVPGGIWQYKAPEQLIAGSPSARIAPTRTWAAEKMADTYKGVRDSFSLAESDGPRQVVAIAFSDQLQRDLDRYMPPPLRLTRDAAGNSIRPATLLFSEFATPAGKYLLITQVLPDQQDPDKLQLLPSHPSSYILVPGAIQEETIVLDSRRRSMSRVWID